MNYPSTSNQRSGYVYLIFLPIDFASIFIVFSFSKMADLRRHMKYPWLESTLSTFWSLKYTPTPLSVFFILFDVIRKDFMHDSHASQGWLACLARLTRMPCTSDLPGSHALHVWLACLACLTWLARMPCTSDSLASHASHGWLACLACLAHYTNSTHCSFNRMHFQPPILFPCILYKRVSGVAEIHSSIFFSFPISWSKATFK